MTAITLRDIHRIAALARIAITDDEAARLQQELDLILSYVRQLDALDTSGVEPTYQVPGLKNVMREDEIAEYGVTPEELLRNAPQVQQSQIKVPKVL